MNLWTAIVPLQAAGRRKTRLAAALSPIERDRLAQTLFDHVVDALASSPSVGRICVLSADRPTRDGLGWLVDDGRGLNAELQALTVEGPRLVIHADLPLVSTEDIETLLSAAREGGAIAPDRHGTGVNAIALSAGLTIAFRFGPGSFALHQAEARKALTVIERPGLALDIDTPDDLAEAARRGFSSIAAAKPLAAEPRTR